MSKEITTFVVDLAASMGQPHGSSTRMDHALDYVLDVLIAKALKGRKTDFVSVIACHSTATNNPFAGDDAFQGIEVVFNKVCPTYAQIKALRQKLVPNERAADAQSDCFEAMLVAIGLMKEDQRLKFIRNVVVITDNEAAVSSFDSAIAQASKQAINDMNISVVVCAINYGLGGSAARQSNEKGWHDAVAAYNNGSIINSDELMEIVNYRPPLKRVKPIRMFRGKLTFGADPETLTQDEPVTDSTVLSLDVEIFPAVKPELIPQFHQYHLDKDTHNVQKVTTNTEYYVLDGEESDAEDKKERKKIAVEKGDWTDGFKYSNYDLVSVDKNLAESAKLKGEPSLSVMGFIKLNDLPVAFFTKESAYLVPGTMTATRHLVGYNCLCQSLIDLEAAAVVRYVQKANEEVQICALLPSKVKIGTKYSFCMQLVRLPFKEDEKMGRFPNLKLEGSTDSDSKETSNPDSLMESFILAKDFDINVTVKEEKIPQEAFYIENPKAGLPGNQSAMSRSVADESVDSKLTALSPAIHKVTRNLHKIVKLSLDKDDLYEYLNDPDFVSKYLVKENQTNLFNVNNILRLNSSNNVTWLADINKGAKDISTKLAKNTRYIKMEDYKKAKKRKTEDTIFKLPTSKTQGSYGADEGDFDEELDLESLLQED